MATTVDKKQQQADCFKLLAACFYEPDMDLFLQEKLCDNLVSLLSACGTSPAAEAARSMLVALTEQSEEELKVEYARLFVGPFELIAPPYGSVYIEDKRLVMGDSTMAVKKMYKDAGLSLEVKDAPDHIAFELEFMHFLCLAEIDAATQSGKSNAHNYLKMQSDFMGKFLRPWIPAFCNNIRQGTHNHFYASLADCLEAFVSQIAVDFKQTEHLGENENNDACRATA